LAPLCASAKAQTQVKRKLGLHAFGVIKENIKMIALLRGNTNWEK